MLYSRGQKEQILQLKNKHFFIILNKYLNSLLISLIAFIVGKPWIVNIEDVVKLE